MKQVELRRIRLSSVVRIYFAIGMVVGLVCELLWLYCGKGLEQFSVSFDSTVWDGRAGLPFGAHPAGLIVNSLAYGLAVGTCTTLGAMLYNILAAWIGGVEIEVEEDLR